MTSSDLVLIGSYDSRLVVLSVLIAIAASYTALDLAGRVTAARGRAQLYWMAGGSTAMGIGIWSMHYIGMLAFRLPVPVQYDWPTVLLSLLAGILSSALGLFVVSRQTMGFLRAGTASILMGAGIAALHYTSMAAMRLPAMCEYSLPLGALSIVLAIGFSLAALWLMFLFREGTARRWRKVAGALLMGVAISAMHYTGMAAARFTRSAEVPDLSHAVSISSLGAAGIATVALMVLWIALLTSRADRLQTQRSLLDELFEQNPLAVALVKSDNRIIRINREFSRVFRYAPREAIGHTLSELVVPDEFLDEVQRSAEIVWQQGGRADTEGIRRRKDGSRLNVAMVFVPFLVPGGEIAAYAIYHDITERKRAEESHRASEARWRSVFENSAVGIAIANHPEGVFAATNRAYQEMMGYTDEELRKMSHWDITYEEDRAPNLKLRNELWEGKRQQFTHEKRYLRKDGSLIWVRNTVSLLPGIEPTTRLGIAIVEDITERRRAQDRLQRSEAYLAEAQRLSQIGSWAWKLSSDELFWSQETFRIFGFDPATTSAPVLETFLQRIHPEDRPRIEQGLKEAPPEESRNYAGDYRIVLPNGTIRHVHDVVHIVANEAGQIIERYGVVMDVTERKRAEEEQRYSFEQLRALAARLQTAREEERARVAREIHDELGQALTAIKMELASLFRNQPGAEARQSILKLVDETIRSVRRISTELRPGILDDLGLVAAMEWAAEEFQGRTGTKVEVRLPEGEIAIDAERATALFRIFQETLTNVARHANATQVNVLLAEQNGNLLLEVHDNGQGIGPEMPSNGTSLGILGMRERALLLGGEFTISGVPGNGTDVRVRIPEANRRQAAGK